MQSRSVHLILALSFALAGCAQPIQTSAGDTATPDTPSSSVTRTAPLRTLTSNAPTKSTTITPRIEPSATLPGATRAPVATRTQVQVPVSTFVPALAVTRTPSLPAQCPAAKQTVTIPNPETLPPPDDPRPDPQLFEKTILDILNGGGIESLITAFSGYYTERDLAHEDITGDGIAELIIGFRALLTGKLYVFGCDQQQYKTLLVEDSIYDYRPAILAIRDLNLDGVKELVIEQTTCHYCTGIRVYEWDGQQFQSLVRRWWIDTGNNKLTYDDFAELSGYSTASVADVDQNGTYELVLDGGTPSYLGGLSGGDGPWREQTVTYGWDGQHFVWYSQEYRPPIFRFEAIQDGDTASLRGQYDLALDFYQAAIFSDTLKSWSADIWYRLVEENAQERIGYPDISNMPFNQPEYDQLAAYARYRIMLLHLLHGYESDAQTVYETLQKKFPQGNSGHTYVELAAVFWMEYQLSHDIGSACNKAVAYATDHEDLLTPLGNNHGYWSRRYVPQSVCPLQEAK